VRRPPTGRWHRHAHDQRHATGDGTADTHADRSGAVDADGCARRAGADDEPLSGARGPTVAGAARDVGSVAGPGTDGTAACGTGGHVRPVTRADGARHRAIVADAATAPARHTRSRAHQGAAAAHTRNIRPGAIAGGTTAPATLTDRAAARAVGSPYRATADGIAARADPAIGVDNPTCAPADKIVYRPA